MCTEELILIPTQDNSCSCSGCHYQPTQDEIDCPGSPDELKCVQGEGRSTRYFIWIAAKEGTEK